MNLPEPSLKEVQRWMKSKILPPTASGAIAPAQEIQLNPQNQVPGIERMAVYAEGYIVRMEEALLEAYPAVRQILGKEIFSRMAADYARVHPSRDANLSFSGRHLPKFLAAWPKTGELPFLPDLAQLEWFVVESFHAFDEPAMTPEDWAAQADALESMTFGFQPSLRRLSSSWPILDLWQARQTPRTEIKIDLVNRPQRVLIHRAGETVHCELISEPEDFLLSVLLERWTLADACEALLSRFPEQNFSLQDRFSRWASNGLFVR